MTSVERKLMAQIAVLVFAFSLVSGVAAGQPSSGAQAGSTTPAASQMAKATNRQTRPQYRNGGSTEGVARDRRCLLEEDRRRPAVPRQKRAGAEADHPAGDVQQDQGYGRRQTAEGDAERKIVLSRISKAPFASGGFSMSGCDRSGLGFRDLGDMPKNARRFA